MNGEQDEVKGDLLSDFVCLQRVQVGAVSRCGRGALGDGLRREGHV